MAKERFKRILEVSQNQAVVERWRAAEWANIGFKPHRGQVRAFHQYLTHRFCWFPAGRRGGKSDFAGKGLVWPEFARTPDSVREGESFPKKILLLAPHFKQAKIIFGKPYRLAHDKGIPLRVDRFSEQSMELETAWGALIACATARNIKAIPGFDWDLIIADELPLFEGDPEEIFDAMLFPTLLDRLGRFVGIGTPDFPGSYSYSLMMKGKNPKNKRWGTATWSTDENIYLPHVKEELEELRLETPLDIYLRQYMAKYMPREGLVYPEAQDCIMDEKEAIRIEKLIFRADRWYRTIDFGFTNPFACITVGRIGDVLYIWDEYYRKKLIISRHAEVLAKFDSKYRYEVNLADPEDPNSIRELAAYRYRHPTRGRIKLTGGWVLNYNKPKIVERIDLLRSLMVKGMIRIHPRCATLIEEFGLERYPDRRAMRNFDEKPVDADNHGTSALGYLADYLFGRIIGSDTIFSSGATRDSEAVLAGYDDAY